MAWTSPRLWVAGETVTAAIMNSAIRDNLLHIAGSAGFTAAPVTTGAGIQPGSGYFMGATEVNRLIQSGATVVVGSTSVAVSFQVEFTSTAPNVVPTSPISSATAHAYNITSTGFTLEVAGTTASGTCMWFAAGAKT
jgi:hypothetical protein